MQMKVSMSWVLVAIKFACLKAAFAFKDNTFKLLDGDKIAGLAAGFIIDLVGAAGLNDIKIGVVQTAYANGSSTRYLTKVLVRTLT
jgi:hypothetical protein